MVPPPLPLSAPPNKPDPNFIKQDVLNFIKQDLIKQDAPNFTKPHKFSAKDLSFDLDQNYDIPSSMRQRSNSISADYDFPKTTLIDSDDSRSCTCQIMSNRNNLNLVKRCCTGNKMESLPSVPSFDLKVKQNNNIAVEVRAMHNQYSNVFLKKDGPSERDSIPEEIAPPPPILQSEAPEEHYKMVGTPIPITTAFKIS